MKIIDISMEVRPDMMTFKDKEENKPKISYDRTFDTGMVHETRIEMNLHTGTHMDAPMHMIKDGETIDSYCPEGIMTKAKVLDFTELSDSITKNDLEGIEIEKGDFLLFKTCSSFSESFLKDFVFIREDAAKYLAEKEITGVGTDALGIERSQTDHMSHITLLENGIQVLEGLRLAHVDEGEYKLIALPIKLINTEAAPVRAVLIK